MNDSYDGAGSIVKTPINWSKALDDLGCEAFYMLSVLYLKLTDASDKSIMKFTGFGLSKHRKYKRELMNNQYLLVEQIGRAKYKYTVGSP